MPKASTLTTLPCDKPGTLLTEAQKLLATAQGQTSLLAVATNTGLPFHWLRKFAAGSIDAPSVNRVQFLYEKLSGKTL